MLILVLTEDYAVANPIYSTIFFEVPKDFQS